MEDEATNFETKKIRVKLDSLNENLSQNNYFFYFYLVVGISRIYFLLINKVAYKKI